MERIRCIIVDDEHLAIEGLKLLIEKVDSLQLMAHFDNAIAANTYLASSQKIDLIFTDVQMPQISGTEWIQSLQNSPFVIFTSAHPNFALQGFDLNAVDYLLKPISFDRFLSAVNKVKKQLWDKLHTIKMEEEYIFLRCEGRHKKILLNAIIYIEGMKDYVKIYIDGEKKPLLTAMNLKTFLKNWPSIFFIRIHKSFIVNRNKVSSFNANSIKIGEKELPLGVSFKSDFINEIKIV